MTLRIQLPLAVVTGKQVMKSENVPEVLAVMATAGLFDDSGKWLYATGLPAKSGVATIQRPFDEY